MTRERASAVGQITYFQPMTARRFC